jgi:hypothetical protein
MDFKDQIRIIGERVHKLKDQFKQKRLLKMHL